MNVKYVAAAALAVVFAGILATPFVFAADDTVVARVDGVEIKKADVMREMSALPPQLQQVPVEQIYPQLLERMIDARLLVKEAAKAKLEDSEDFKNRLARTKERILADMILREKVKPMVNDAKIKAKYDEVIGKMKPEEEVHAYHILVKTEDEAKAVLADLGKGGDFAKLAKEKSMDKASAEKGGDLGFFSKGTMVPAFADAAFSMKDGEISKNAVKTEFGYHIIKVAERRKAKPVALDKVRSQIESGLADEAANTYVEGLRKSAKIERFDLEGKPMTDPKAK